MSNKNKTPCPKCGTTDCISLEEYQSKIRIVGAGILEVPSKAILRCCETRQILQKVNPSNFIVR